MMMLNSDRPKRLNQPNLICREIPRLAPSLIASFEGVGVADLLEGLGPETLMDPAIHPIWAGGWIAGPALTVWNAPGDTLMLHRAMALSRPGDVLVIVAEPPSPNATWGKLVTTVSQARRVAGAIVDGSVRDVADIRAASFPVWACSVSPRGSTRKGPGSINVPVVCGGVYVEPGDLIVADDDGVLVVPREKVGEALERGRERKRRETELLPKLATGQTPYELWGLQPAVQNSGVMEIPGTYLETQSQWEAKNDG